MPRVHSIATTGVIDVSAVGFMSPGRQWVATAARDMSRARVRLNRIAGGSLARIAPKLAARSDQPAFAFNPAAWMPATAQASSLSEVSPETPTAPRSVVPSMISTPPGTGTRAPLAIVFTASMK